MSLSPPAFKRCLVVFNPGSTRAARARQHIQELRTVFGSPNVEVVTTRAADRDTVELLRTHTAALGPATLLAVAAGDGTTSAVAEFLARWPELPPRARRTALLPLWCGNANDLAHMLNGQSYPGRLKTVLSEGRLVPVFPLLGEFKYSDGSEQARLALCYMSFGATAQVARRLSDPAYRREVLRKVAVGRSLRDLAMLAGTVASTPRFRIDQAGRQRTVFELMYLNGSRMGRIEGSPLQLTRKGFYPIELAHIWPDELLALAWRLVSQRTGTTRPQRFTTRQPVWAEFDGETLHVPADTKVQVRLADRPIWAVSTRLASDSQ